jgi:hypothetical protein
MARMPAIRPPISRMPVGTAMPAGAAAMTVSAGAVASEIRRVPTNVVAE